MSELPELEKPETEEVTEVNSGEEHPSAPVVSTTKKSRRGLWIGVVIFLLVLGLATLGIVNNRWQSESHQLQNVQIAVEAGAWDTAVSLADTLLNQQPAFLLRHTAEATGLRGVAYYYLGDLDAAEADLGKALADDPDLVDLAAYQAAVYYLQGNTSDALAETQTAMGNADLLPPHLKATLLANQADMYARQDENEAALTAVADALELSDFLPAERVAALYALQAALFKANNADDAALESLDTAQSFAVTLAPEQVTDMALTRTFLLASHEQKAEAFAASEEALAAGSLTDEEKVALYTLRAKILFDQGDLDTAVAEAQNASMIDNSLMLPHALLAAQAYRDLDYETAAAEATTALDMEEDDPFSAAIAHRVIGGVLTWQGDAPAALAELDAALDINADDVAALALRTYNKINVGDFAGAKADAATTFNISPEAPDTLWAQALGALIDGDQELANVLMNQAIAQVDNRPEFYLARSISYRYTVDDPQELADIEDALALAPTRPDVLNYELSYRYEQFEYDDGLDLEALAQQFIEQYPTWDVGYSMLASYQQDFTKDLDAALENFNHAIELRPNHPGSYASRGDLYLDMNNLDAARADFEKALELFPDYFYATYGLSVIASREGNLDISQQLMESLVEKLPRNLRAKNELAFIFLDKGENEEAWNLAHQVLAADPYDERALLLRAILRSQNGQARPALADIENVLKRLPHHPFAWLLKSFTLFDLGDKDGAKEAAEQALELDSEMYDAYRILFSVAIEAGDMEDAEAQLAHWLDAVPDYAFNPETAGLMQLNVGQFLESIENLTIALDKDPTDPDALLFNRALAHQQLGDLEAWNADLQEALQASTNLDLIADAEIQLSGNTVAQEGDDRFRFTQEEAEYTLTYSNEWGRLVPEDDTTDLELIFETDDGIVVLLVRTFVEPTPTKLEDVVAIFDDAIARSPFNPVTKVSEYVTINDSPAHLREYEFTSEGRDIAGRQYLFVKDNFVILIVVEGSATLFPDLEPEIDLTVNSFEWLE